MDQKVIQATGQGQSGEGQAASEKEVCPAHTDLFADRLGSDVAYWFLARFPQPELCFDHTVDLRDLGQFRATENLPPSRGVLFSFFQVRSDRLEDETSRRFAPC